MDQQNEREQILNAPKRHFVAPKFLLGKKGHTNHILKLDTICFVYTQNKMVYIFDNTGTKFISEYSLGYLEEVLDPSVFFRGNRQYLLNLHYIKCFRNLNKLRIEVEMVLPQGHKVVLSQWATSRFRRWVQHI